MCVSVGIMYTCVSVWDHMCTCVSVEIMHTHVLVWIMHACASMDHMHTCVSVWGSYAHTRGAAALHHFSPFSKKTENSQDLLTPAADTWYCLREGNASQCVVAEPFSFSDILSLHLGFEKPDKESVERQIFKGSPCAQ